MPTRHLQLFFRDHSFVKLVGHFPTLRQRLFTVQLTFTMEYFEPLVYVGISYSIHEMLSVGFRTIFMGIHCPVLVERQPGFVE